MKSRDPMSRDVYASAIQIRSIALLAWGYAAGVGIDEDDRLVNSRTPQYRWHGQRMSDAADQNTAGRNH